jgi:hypothetical protein
MRAGPLRCDVHHTQETVELEALMEPLLILIPGVLGGLVLALLIAGRRQRTPSALVTRPLEAPSPSLINMAHIRVEGVGGLGMVAAIIIVAISDPSIRVVTILAAVLGAGLALALIALRRRTGVFPSTGDGPGDRSVLGLDVEPRHFAGGRRRGPKRSIEGGCSSPVAA